MALFGKFAHDGLLDCITFHTSRHKTQNTLPLCFRAEDSLEMVLFESQEMVLSLKADCTRMEDEKHSLLIANEALTRE